MAKVLGFPIILYDKSKLDIMSDNELYDTYIQFGENIICYHCVEDFFDSLNDNEIDINHNWWMFVNID